MADFSSHSHNMDQQQPDEDRNEQRGEEAEEEEEEEEEQEVQDNNGLASTTEKTKRREKNDGEETENAPASNSSRTTTTLNANEIKLKVQFKSVGGAPILKKNKFQIKASETVAVVVTFLRKTLKLQDRDPLFAYVNSSFAPSLDQTIGTLHACFAVNDELVIHYALVKSWG